MNDMQARAHQQSARRSGRRSGHRLASAALGASLSALALAPLQADDTEIYVGGNNGLSGVKSNLLFILDTSGSMASRVVTQEPYDPATTYRGCFSSNRIYWTTGAPMRSCYTSRWFETSYNSCQAASDALANTGFFQGRAARYHNGSWRRLSGSTNGRRRQVECRADAGVHGRDAADPMRWAQNGGRGGSGWSDDEGSQVNWNNTGLNYTLYSGNYMNYMKNPPTQSRTRLEIVQDVLADLVDSTSEVNIGLMRFDRYGGGGMVTNAMEDISSNREGIKTEARSYYPAGVTPLSESLYEAALYYRGAAVDYGNSSNPKRSVADSRKPGRPSEYLSPIEYQCQKSNIVLLSDGNPVSDTGANRKIPALPGFSAALGSRCANDHSRRGQDGMCLDELAEYLATVDQAPHISGKQFVTTHTVGFAIDHPLLKDTARRGGGGYYTADDSLQLANAFSQIVNEILAQDSTFAAPAVAVNAFNRTTHRDSLYFTLFKPDGRPQWPGNLKKYRLGFTTNPQSGERTAVLEDKNGNPAVDPETGFFRDSSFSFWHPGGSSADGPNVDKGGVAARLALPRKVFTVTGDSLRNVSLSNSAHALHEDNAQLTAQLLGIAEGATQPSREQLLQWARGVDIDGEYGPVGGTRQELGDPLHGQAVVVQYGGSDDNPDLAVFFSTNDGYLHAVDENSGEELFAFVPPELLPNLIDLYNNDPGTPRPYGLDGTLVPWVNDIDEDGTIEAGDHVYLYGGMRRGGHSYYAYDVTSRSQPKLLWRISNDPDGDGTPDGDFAELGQTWSTPVLGKISLNGNDRKVLIFGGGYDPDQDANMLPTDDIMGRAVYIVDARSGQRLWWAGPSGSGADLALTAMTNSIPSKVNAIDIDGDGYIDRLYVGDTRAQIWRFDIRKDNVGASDLVVGGRPWALGENSEAGNRRFYYPPDVALSGGFPGVGPHLTLVIGSGYRAHPLNETIHDRIYVLRDDDIFSLPVNYTARGEADLFNATDNAIGEGSQAQREAAMEDLIGANGWYISLDDSGVPVGEKVLATPLVINDTAVVSTFTPQAANPNAALDSCAPRIGSGRVYYLNLADGQPVQNFDGIGDDARLTAEDRRVELQRTGIPPSPSLIIGAEETTLLAGPEIIPNPLVQEAIKTYWHDR